MAKNPDRPFIVNVAGVDVRAVGTIFSVKLAEDELGVLVSEGKVSVKAPPPNPGPGQPDKESFIEIGQKAVVRFNQPDLQVDVLTLSKPEIEAATRWQPRLLDFDAAPLGTIVDEFNRSNPIQVVLGDPSLEMMSLSSSFWSDKVEGFVRLMESSFGMKAEWRSNKEIVLLEAN